MMRYPFQPDVLDSLPEKLAQLFRDLEDTLLHEICSCLNVTNELNEVSVQSIRALRSHGITLDEIKKAIEKTTGIAEKELDAIFDDVVERNKKYYNELIDLSGITRPEYLVSDKDVEAIRNQTKGEFQNITASLGFLVDNGRTMLPPARAYQWALDRAVMQVQSGVIDYNKAISGAISQLADSGLRENIIDPVTGKAYPAVVYESGHRDHIDVAARRAVMTGVSQLCAKYTENSAEWLGTALFEVSAHIGARDTGVGWQNHESWQGKVYSTQRGDIYPNIYEVCGLGYVDGLEGANCRHWRSAWVEGVSERTYTDKQLEEMKGRNRPQINFEGRTYTDYEASQKQRQIERTIRKLKRRYTAFKAQGNNDLATAVRAKERRLAAKYKAFSEASGLKEQRERMRVNYKQ